MADSQFASSSRTQRARWLALPAVLFTAGGALLMWRRGQPETALPPIVDIAGSDEVQTTPPPVQAKPRKPQSPVRWLLYLGAAMLCGGLLVVLQTTSPELSAALFTLLLLASVLYGAFQSADKIGRFILGLRHVITYPRAVLNYNAAGLSLIAGAVAIVLAFWSAIMFWDAGSYGDLVHPAAHMFILSMLALWMAFALHPTNSPMMTVVLERPIVEPAVTGFGPGLRLFMQRAGKRLALFSGIVLLVILTEINGQFIKSDLIELASIHLQFVLLVLASILVAVGLTGVGGRVAAAPSTRSWLERWRPLWPIGLITLLALVLRFWQLEAAMRFLVDEAAFIGGIYGVKDVPFNGLLQPFSSVTAFPYTFPYWQALMTGVFGGGLVGVRATSAIIGTLTVPALYFLAVTVFNRKTAVLAALLLATFPPHLQFSRIGMNNIADPLFGTLALAFLMRGLQAKRRSDFALAGIMLGFTQYFYEGGRLLYVPLVLLTLVSCIVFAQLADAPAGISPWGALLLRLRRIGSNVLIMLVGLVVFALPIYLTLVGMRRPALARFVDNGLGLGPVYWAITLFAPNGYRDHIHNHIVPALGMYFNRIDTTFYYSQTTPLILTGMLPVVMIGFAFACYYWRKPGPMLLIFWVLATAFGNSMMKDSTSSSRFVIAFPALMLLAAVGLCYVVPMMVRRSRWQWPVILGLGVVLALYQTNFYFNLHLPEYGAIFRSASPGPDGYDAAWRSLKFPPGTNIHLISTPVYNPIEAEGLIQAWRTDIAVDTLLSRRLSPRYLKNLDCGVDHAFYVQKKDEEVIKMLNHYFKLEPPQFTPFTDIAPTERFVLYYAPYDPDDGSLYSAHCKERGHAS